MNATMAVSHMDEMKHRLKTTWNTGDYDAFSRYMENGAEHFYQRLNIARGATLLDVACGSGQLALIAARAGIRVTGCDIAPRWVERARARAGMEGSPPRSTKAMPKRCRTRTGSSTWWRA